MPSIRRHRYRYPNGREVELVQVGDAWTCPVCGNLFDSPSLEPADGARRDEHGVTLLPTESGLIDTGYSDCPACDAEFFGADEPKQGDVTGDPGDTARWRQRRGEYVRKYGRTPDVYAGLERIRREPDLAHIEPREQTPHALAAVFSNNLSALGDLARDLGEREAEDFDGWSPLLWATALGA